MKKDMTFVSDSYTALNVNGEVVHFTVLSNNILEDTYIEAKKIARKEKFKKLRFFSFVGA